MKGSSNARAVGNHVSLDVELIFGIDVDIVVGSCVRFNRYHVPVEITWGLPEMRIPC